MPNAELGKVAEKTEYSQKPENHRNHNYGIQDALDLALHRYVAVHQPKQQPNHGKRYNNGDKWHFVLQSLYGQIQFSSDPRMVRVSRVRSPRLGLVDVGNS